MATALAGRPAGLDHPECALEVALRFAGEALLLERPGQSIGAAARNRGHHGRSAIGSCAGGKRPRDWFSRVLGSRADDGFGVTCRFCRLCLALFFADYVCWHGRGSPLALVVLRGDCRELDLTIPIASFGCQLRALHEQRLFRWLALNGSICNDEH